MMIAIRIYRTTGEIDTLGVEGDLAAVTADIERQKRAGTVLLEGTDGTQLLIPAETITDFTVSDMEMLP